MKTMSGGKKKKKKRLLRLQDKANAKRQARHDSHGLSGLPAGQGYPGMMQPDSISSRAPMVGLPLSGLGGLQGSANPIGGGGNFLASFLAQQQQTPASFLGQHRQAPAPFLGHQQQHQQGASDQDRLLQSLIRENQQRNELILQQQAQLYAAGLTDDPPPMSEEMRRRLIALQSIRRS
jgi:hypothetical protein